MVEPPRVHEQPPPSLHVVRNWCFTIIFLSELRFTPLHSLNPLFALPPCSSNASPIQTLHKLIQCLNALRLCLINLPILGAPLLLYIPLQMDKAEAVLTTRKGLPHCALNRPVFITVNNQVANSINTTKPNLPQKEIPVRVAL